MHKYFFKTVVLLSVVAILTFGAGVAKAENFSPSLADLIATIQQQINNLKVQLLAAFPDPITTTTPTTPTTPPTTTPTTGSTTATPTTSPSSTGLSIISISPNSSTVQDSSGSGIDVNVLGTGFSTGSVVYYGGTPMVTTFSSSTLLRAHIPGPSLSPAGNSYSIRVQNLGSTVVSNSLSFNIVAESEANPRPTITSISPGSMVSNSTAVVTITGTGFISSSVVNTPPYTDPDVAGAISSTTYISSTQLRVTISSDRVTRSISLVVVNPAPGGGTSNQVTFTITGTNPAPAPEDETSTSGCPSGALYNSMTGTLCTSATPLTNTQNQISTIQSQLTELQKQLSLRMQVSAPVTPPSVTVPTPEVSSQNFTKIPRFLGVGDSGPHVVILQTVLVGKKLLQMPPGVPMGYYGLRTKSAVQKLQEDAGITPTTGEVGPKTLDVINQILVIKSNDKLEETASNGTCPTCDTLSSPESLTGLIKKSLTGALAYAVPNDRPTLPNNCTVYEGSREEASWLWYWHTSSSWISSCLSSIGLNSSCSLTDTQINLYANTCNNSYTTMEERVNCVLRYVNDRLSIDSSNACRHHARCTKKILEAMGIEQTYQGGRLGSDGHYWNEVISEGGTYYIDSYNKIMFWCPAGTR